MAREEVGDFDLVVIAERLYPAARALCRRRIAKWLSRGGGRISVPVSVGLLRQSWLPRLPFTLFNYEMRYGYRLLAGSDPIPLLPRYPVEEMPVIEATRLLFNRGVALWGDTLRRRAPVGGDEIRGIGRRNQTALAAIGDALLIAVHAYHWSYAGRLRNVATSGVFDRFDGELRARYEEALKCRIAGVPVTESDRPAEDAEGLLRLHEAAFRFVEERRLGRAVSSWRHYTTCDLEFPSHLVPPTLKRLVRLFRMFGPPRGTGFYLGHLRRTPEEALLSCFPAMAYGAGDCAVEGTLNWRPAGSPSPIALWERFHDAWTRLI